MYTTSIAVQVLPDITETDKIIAIVDKVIAYIASTGYHYVVGPFETTIEGDLEGLMEIAKRCQEIPIEEGAPSTKTYIKVFHSPKGVLTIDEKTGKYNK